MPAVVVEDDPPILSMKFLAPADVGTSSSKLGICSSKVSALASTLGELGRLSCPREEKVTPFEGDGGALSETSVKSLSGLSSFPLSDVDDEKCPGGSASRSRPRVLSCLCTIPV